MSCLSCAADEMRVKGTASNFMDPSLKTLLEASSGESPLHFSGLAGSALSYALSKVFLKLRQPLFLVVPDTQTASRLEEELRCFLPEKELILQFPSLGVLPYYGLSPNSDALAARLAFLHTLLYRREPFLAIIPTSALTHRLPPASIFKKHIEYLVCGDEIRRGEILKKLVEAGYLSAPLVEDTGTFSLRGGILDIFPPQLKGPVRVEFFGDKIESLRHFDPETQRSQETVEELLIIPAREILFTDETIALASKRFREKANDFGLEKGQREVVLESLKNKLPPPAFETYLPIFYPETATLLDYLPKDSRLVWIEPEDCQKRFDEFLREIVMAHEACQTAEKIISPEELFITEDQLKSMISDPQGWIYRELALEETVFHFRTESHEAISLLLKNAHLGEGMLAPLFQRLDEWVTQGLRLWVVATTHAQLVRLKDLFSKSKIPVHEFHGKIPDLEQHPQVAAGIWILEGHLAKGFLWSAERIALLTDQEIFGEKQRRKKATPSKRETFTNFEELQEGDYIVHEEHGVGIYRGLKSLELEGITNDFLLLEYYGKDKLYLPVYRLNLVSRYTAKEGFVPALDRLGSAKWEKSKEKVRKSLRVLAGELLQLYAERATLRGHSFAPPGELYEEFEATFPFEETPDQLRAIEEVNKDLDSDKPMDRLVCGDVGFGKTEVAMRAAFRAILDNKQVAVLVPTTVLALQHERNFRQRFKNFPAVVEMLSRFVKPQRHREIREMAKHGKVDIIIGTHSILSQEMKFKDLGLVIIDEEHRFGVAQKEKLKKFRRLADALTLTATPIPRTLNMSISGIRDLSVIATPPVDRLAIQTFVAQYNESLIREAILRELSRGGQVYFIYNRVQTIEGMKKTIMQLVPEAQVEVAHGQMPENKLEEVMVRFVNREFNVLLCTTIVESGLDIPSANTMIVHRADTFGLAQLYQLRGRIGRSNVRAFAYLLIPGQESITSQARSRLAVLQRYTDLGSGFKIAAHDLEIRGSGNLLGAEQSGHIGTLGYDLYMRLLEEAVLEVKGEGELKPPDPELQLNMPASIPESYIPEATMRLTLYKRLSSATDPEELEILGEEMEDRFGRLPESVVNLLKVMHLKQLAQRVWLKSLRLRESQAVLVFDPRSPVDPAWLVEIFQKEPKRHRWLSQQEMAVQLKVKEGESSLGALEEFLKKIEVIVKKS